MNAPRHRHPEADIQRAIVAFLRLVLPPGSVVHHSAHEQRGGGAAARRRQGIAQGMGVAAGFPDLIVLAEGRVLFLEVKSPRGRLSEAQVEMRHRIRAQGHHHAVVTSVEGAEAALKAAGIPCLGQVAARPLALPEGSGFEVRW